jgi:hypothetical protein
VREVALTRSARFSGDAGKILLTVFLLFVFIGSVQARQQSANNSKKSEPPSGIISGHVYSAATGQPLGKAVVTLQLRSEDPNPPSFETASDGAFAFTALPVGTYDVLIERCGYATHTVEEASTDSDSVIALRAGEKREGLTYHLLRGGVISGTVTDGDNEPVPGLLVEARALPYQPGGDNTSGGADVSAHTDDLGNFRLIGLGPGAYFIVVANNQGVSPNSGELVYREVYYPQAYSLRDAQRVRVNAGEETSGIHVTVRLARVFTLRGHVSGSCSDSGCLLSAAAISSLPAQTGFNSFAFGNGSFELGGLFPGEYSLQARGFRGTEVRGREYFGMGSAHVEVLDRDTDASVSLGPLAELSGTVVDESGKPSSLKRLEIAIAPVGLIEGGGPLERLIGEDDPTSSGLDSAGRFKLTGIDPGLYVLTLGQATIANPADLASLAGGAAEDLRLMYLKQANCAGRDYAKEVFRLNGGTLLSDCKVTIGRDTASINGKVMDGDKGVARQLVVAIPALPELRRNPRYTLTGSTNRDGQFSITGIIPGDYLIFAVTPNVEQSYYALDFAERNPSAGERATFRPGEAKTFVLKPSSAQ